MSVPRDSLWSVVAAEERSRDVRWIVGGAALWLRDRLALTGVIAVAAVASTVLPRWPLTDRGTMHDWSLVLLTVLGIAAAVDVVLDRLADRHSARLDDTESDAGRQAGRRILSELIGFLDTARSSAPFKGVRRAQALGAMQAQAADVAAHMPSADEIRASSYPMVSDNEGWRRLESSTSRGRGDEATTVFDEKSAPDHPI